MAMDSAGSSIPTGAAGASFSMRRQTRRIVGALDRAGRSNCRSDRGESDWCARQSARRRDTRVCARPRAGSACDTGGAGGLRAADGTAAASGAGTRASRSVARHDQFMPSHARVFARYPGHTRSRRDTRRWRGAGRGSGRGSTWRSLGHAQAQRRHGVEHPRIRSFREGGSPRRTGHPTDQSWPAGQRHRDAVGGAHAREVGRRVSGANSGCVLHEPSSKIVPDTLRR